jgi:hypothetical protein
MHEEAPIIPIVIGALALTYFGFEVERRRHRLRAVFNVFDKEESRIAEALERMVESGALKPYVPTARIAHPATG